MAWTTIVRLSIISNQTFSIIWFFPNSGGVSSTIWMHYMDAGCGYRGKAWQELHKNAKSYIENILEAISYKLAAVRPPTFHL